MENNINIKTGKPFSRQTIWRRNNPYAILEGRERSKSPEQIEKGIIRRMVNREQYSNTKKLYYQKNKIKLAQKAMERAKNNPKVVKAHNEVTFKYKKSINCDICGGIERLQAHHWNYDKPLLVNTLCRDCHEVQHTNKFDRWLKCRLKADEIINKKSDKLLEVAN